MVTVCPSQFATRRTLFHVLVGCGLLMLKVSRLKLPVIWLLVSMWLNTLTKDRKSGSAGMPRPISYAVFCLKKKTRVDDQSPRRARDSVPVCNGHCCYRYGHHRDLPSFPTRRSSDLVTVCPSQFATRRTLFHVLVGCGLLMLKVSRLKLPVIWLLVSMWLNTLTKSQIWTLLLKV